MFFPCYKLLTWRKHHRKTVPALSSCIQRSVMEQASRVCQVTQPFSSEENSVSLLKETFLCATSPTRCSTGPCYSSLACCSCTFNVSGSCQPWLSTHATTRCCCKVGLYCDGSHTCRKEQTYFLIAEFIRACNSFESESAHKDRHRPSLHSRSRETSSVQRGHSSLRVQTSGEGAGD